MLGELCEEFSIRVDVVDVLTTCAVPGGATVRVSSTRLREAVEAGEMAAANALLGRRYRLVADAWSVDGDGSIGIEPRALCNLAPSAGEFGATASFVRGAAAEAGARGADQRVIDPSACDDEEAAGLAAWRVAVTVEGDGRLRILDDDGGGAAAADRSTLKRRRQRGLYLALDFD